MSPYQDRKRNKLYCIKTHELEVIILNLDWLLGFIEAKGSFNIPIQSGYTPRPKFTIDANVKYERVMKKIWNYFVNKSLEPYPLRINKNSIKLEVKGVDRCLKLFKFLSKLNWQTIKRESFLKWGQILVQIKDKRHLNEQERLLLFIQCREINS